MKYWIFDFDGTLVNTEGFFDQCFGYALEPFGHKIDSSYIETIRHVHPLNIFDGLLGKNDAQIALKRLAEKGEEVADHMKPFAGIEEVLKTLSSENVGLAIWTGRDAASARKILQKTNLDNYFEMLISGTCVENNKPNQEGLLRIVRSFGGPQDHHVMVGDHHHDVEPAKEMGCVSVHARWKDNPHELPEHIKADHQFDSVAAFHEWILKQLKHD